MDDSAPRGDSDAAIAYRLWKELLGGGYAPDVQDKDGALALFRECLCAVRHRGADATIVMGEMPEWVEHS